MGSRGGVQRATGVYAVGHRWRYCIFSVAERARFFNFLQSIKMLHGWPTHISFTWILSLINYPEIFVAVLIFFMCFDVDEFVNSSSVNNYLMNFQ